MVIISSNGAPCVGVGVGNGTKTLKEMGVGADDPDAHTPHAPVVLAASALIVNSYVVFGVRFLTVNCGFTFVMSSVGTPATASRTFSTHVCSAVE